MNKDICTAIKTKSVIKFFYNGGIREVEPYCYGVSTADNDVLRGYQIGGYSKSGNTVGWKLYSVSNISQLTITDKHFASIRPDYKPNDSAMSTIYCNV